MSNGKYILATGKAAENRLSLLNQVFGPSTRELLKRVGIATGWHVAEIGCGSGQSALWIGAQVGLDGSVAAVDMSADQLGLAKRNAIIVGVKNVSFHQAGAYDTGLPRDSFDMTWFTAVS